MQSKELNKKRDCFAEGEEPLSMPQIAAKGNGMHWKGRLKLHLHRQEP